MTQTHTTTHTPGPWTRHTACGKTYASVRGIDGRCVADCGSRSDQVAQANARLIASAPDLLQALYDLLGLVGDGDTAAVIAEGYSDPDTVNRILDASVAAIARATGKGV